MYVTLCFLVSKNRRRKKKSNLWLSEVVVKANSLCQVWVESIFLLWLSVCLFSEVVLMQLVSLIFGWTVTSRTKCVTVHSRPEPGVINPTQCVIVVYYGAMLDEETCLSCLSCELVASRPVSHTSLLSLFLHLLLARSKWRHGRSLRPLVGNMCPLCWGTEDEEMNTARASLQAPALFIDPSQLSREFKEGCWRRSHYSSQNHILHAKSLLLSFRQEASIFRSGLMRFN